MAEVAKDNIEIEENSKALDAGADIDRRRSSRARSSGTPAAAMKKYQKRGVKGKRVVPLKRRKGKAEKKKGESSDEEVSDRELFINQIKILMISV